jgi:hypothetical protein
MTTPTQPPKGVAKQPETQSVPGPEQIELSDCPFCGVKPKFGLTKRTGCQLHGDPIQYVTLACVEKKCPAKPQITGRHDIYWQGEDKGCVKVQELEAKKLLADVWNTRPTLTAPAFTSKDARIKELETALSGLLEVCHCTNDCDPDDMTCATNVARKTLAAKE